MGKFSDYVSTIKQQTDGLREVVSAKSGIDCSKMSIGECAVTMDTVKVSEIDTGYDRPIWYPDLESIISKAPNITKAGITYYPVFIALFNTAHVSTTFSKANSTSTTAPNYYAGTGCDAYIFGDSFADDIINTDEDTLQVGSSIEHKWNFKNFLGTTDAYSKVTWVIGYSANISSLELTCLFSNLIEIIVYQGTFKKLFYGNYTTNDWCPVKYVKLCKDCHVYAANITFSNFLAPCRHLRVFENNVPEPMVFSSGAFFVCSNLKYIINNGHMIINRAQGNLVDMFSLKRLVINDKFQYTPYSNLSSWYNLEHLIIDTETIDKWFSSLYGLKTVFLSNIKYIKEAHFLYNTPIDYVKIPDTLVEWKTGTNTLDQCPYVELFNNFNLSGTNLTGCTIKKTQWLKDLCGWLKDRTGEEAGSFIIGTKNLNNANAIYLTFNPNDKRDITFDGVTAETEGAISITEFITTQLNWTLS